MVSVTTAITRFVFHGYTLDLPIPREVVVYTNCTNWDELHEVVFCIFGSNGG